MNSNNNNLSLNEIASLYYDEIFKYCRRRVRSDEDAYDLTQSVFLALSERYTKIDMRCVRKWMYNVAHNKIADYYEKNKKEKENLADVDLTDELPDISYDFTDAYTDAEIESHREAILENLNANEKALYNEVYCQKLPYPVLAEKYEISEVALRKRVSRLQYKIMQLIKLILYQ